MDKKYTHHLINPCKNRGIKLVINNDGSVFMNGIKFERVVDCEDYLENKPRIDFCEVKK